MVLSLAPSDDNPTVQMVVGRVPVIATAAQVQAVRKRLSCLTVSAALVTGCGFAVAVVALFAISGVPISHGVARTVADVTWLAVIGLIVAVGRDYVNRQHAATVKLLVATHSEDIDGLRRSFAAGLMDVRTQMALQRAEFVAQVEDLQRSVAQVLDVLPDRIEQYGDRRATEEAIATLAAAHTSTGTDGFMPRLAVVRQGRQQD